VADSMPMTKKINFLICFSAEIGKAKEEVIGTEKTTYNKLKALYESHKEMKETICNMADSLTGVQVTLETVDKELQRVQVSC
jgi:hypothetical protein